MSSTSFAASHIRPLVEATKKSLPVANDEGSATPTPHTQQLYKLLHGLDTLDSRSLRSTVESFVEIEEQDESQGNIVALSQEDTKAKRALESRVLVGVYAEVLGRWLQEASEADAEAEWWASTARSQRSLLSYFIATLPERLRRTFHTFLNALRAHHLPLRLTSFTPQTLHQLFPRGFRTTGLTTAFFPHLLNNNTRGARTFFLFASPLELIRQECEVRQRELVRIRDARARELGRLTLMRGDIERAVSKGFVGDVVVRLRAVVGSGDNESGTMEGAPDALASRLGNLLLVELPGHETLHAKRIAALSRPSRLTLLWPRLALIPPLVLIAIRVIYGSRESIMESLLTAHDTVKGFWFGYVMQPIRDILDTVRTGGDESARLVSREGVKADIESLERMSIALSRDKLSLNDVDLQAITDQIRAGDLSPVLRIYEDDMKAPFRSAVTGTLVRSLLIQIQKAKVDLDQALSGIDKLLRSQELTFAFVGVAPALAIVYAAESAIRRLVTGSGIGKKKLGGRKEREAAWLAMRHIERLLLMGAASGEPDLTGDVESRVISPASSSILRFEDTSDPNSNSESDTNKDTDSGADAALPALTTGLLLISVARLRTYAGTCLPARTLLREGVLADIADLESPALGREAKLRVVERMWRSWAGVLGWRGMDWVR